MSDSLRRRRLLTTFAGVGSVCLTGCSGGETTPTDTPTPEPTPSGTPTPNPGIVPRSRAFVPTARASDGYALTAERWFALDVVRYETETGHDTVEPFEGVFVGYEFRLANGGTERLDPVPDTELTLQVAGETFEHVHALRGEIEFSRADQPDDEPQIRPLVWYDPLAPGESARLQLVFDVPAFPAYRHYLAWDHEGTVEGADEPAYLYPTA